MNRAKLNELKGKVNDYKHHRNNILRFAEALKTLPKGQYKKILENETIKSILAEYDINDEVSTEPTPQVESVSVKDLTKDYKKGRVTKEEIKNYVKQGLIFVSDYVTITGEEYTE